MKFMQLCRPDPTVLLALLMLIATGSSWAEPTIGQQFRDIMAEIDARCRKEKLGPYLDPNEPPRSHKRTNGSCDILKVKPVDPLATEEGRFAYSIKLPPPHDKPKVEYKKGMSAETYFKELCEKEAGEWVLKTVEGVEGIKIMRPSIQEVRTPMLYEMPASAFFANYKAQGHFVSSINGKYAYVDAVEFQNGESGKTQLTHYYLDTQLPTRVPPYGVGHHSIKHSQARYGYTYRGLNRPHEREYGIVGGELIVLDMRTNEVLAFRRLFYRSTFKVSQSLEPMSSTVCRNVPYAKDGDNFIAEVLKPAAQVKGDEK